MSESRYNWVVTYKDKTVLWGNWGENINNIPNKGDVALIRFVPKEGFINLLKPVEVRIDTTRQHFKKGLQVTDNLLGDRVVQEIFVISDDRDVEIYLLIQPDGSVCFSSTLNF